MALNYGTSTSISVQDGSTNGLSALVTGAYSQSAVVTTPTTNNIVDCMVQVTVESPTTFTASASTIIEVYAFGSEDGSRFQGCQTGETNEVLGSGMGDATISANGTNATFLGTILMHTTTAGTSQTYYSKPMNIAPAFGGIMPRSWGLLFKNSTGATLPATGHSASYTPIYYN